MTDVPFTHALRGLILAVLLPLVVWSGGCAGNGVGAGRSTIMLLDGAVDQVDEDLDELADAARERALEETRDDPTPDAFDRLMRPWIRVGQAMDDVRASLATSADVIDAVEAGREGDIVGTIGCAATALTRLADLLPSVGVDVPTRLRNAIAFVRGFAEGVCRPRDDPDPEPEAAEASS